MWTHIFKKCRTYLRLALEPFYCYSYLLKIPVMVLTRSQYENMGKEELKS